MLKQNDRMMTVGELADYLGFHKSVIYEWIKD